MSEIRGEFIKADCGSGQETLFCKLQLTLESWAHSDRLRLSQPGIVWELTGKLVEDVLGVGGLEGLVDAYDTVVEH